MKECSKCGLKKDEGEFGKNSEKLDGLQTYCFECMREYARNKGKRKPEGWVRKTADMAAYRREYRKKNLERIRKIESAWAKAHPEARREHDRKKHERRMKSKHGDSWVVGKYKHKPTVKFAGYLDAEEIRKRRSARRHTQRAIKLGKLVKQPCMVCGKINTEAHHPDYNIPLIIEWLCPEHHRQIHWEARPLSHVPI